MIDQRILILASAALIQAKGMDDETRTELQRLINEQMSEEVQDNTHHSHYNERTHFEAGDLALDVPWHNGHTEAWIRVV